MSLDGLRVNHAELRLAAENMHRTVQKLDETLTSLENDIEPKVATWSGEQQEAYRRSKTAWDWAMKEMQDLLDQSQRTVYQSNDEYINADRRGAARFDF